MESMTTKLNIGTQRCLAAQGKTLTDTLMTQRSLYQILGVNQASASGD